MLAATLACCLRWQTAATPLTWSLSAADGSRRCTFPQHAHAYPGHGHPPARVRHGIGGLGWGLRARRVEIGRAIPANPTPEVLHVSRLPAPDRRAMPGCMGPSGEGEWIDRGDFYVATGLRAMHYGAFPGSAKDKRSALDCLVDRPIHQEAGSSSFGSTV